MPILIFLIFSVARILYTNVGASPGIFFRFPGDYFFRIQGLYSKTHKARSSNHAERVRAPTFLLFFFLCVLGFFLILLRGVLFACSMAPTGVFLGFHSFSRVLNVFWVFSLLFTVFFGFERFCFVLAVFGRVSRDLHTSDH